jgi:hypothetical protein
MRRHHRIAVVLSLVGLLISVGLTASASTPHWMIQATPNPAVATDSFLNAVACSSRAACTAVGDAVDKSDNNVALVERWNGTGWTIQPFSNAGTFGHLQGVACPSATACTAVGDYRASTDVTLAQVWNGTQWAIQLTPNPSGSIGALFNGVACPAPSACMAVGQYTTRATGDITLAESWNGTQWTIQPTPNPTGAIGSYLNAVACSSPTNCTAVGWHGEDQRSLTLAEHWNGTHWTIQPTPNPTGAAGGSFLDGVACPSPSTCIAVGYSVNRAGNGLLLAERWNGKGWTILPTVPPAGSLSPGFSRIACASPTACTAVGGYFGATGGVTLAEHWNGTRWTVQPTPNPAGNTVGGFTSVACPSPTACTAVGSYTKAVGTDFTLAESRTG